MHCLVPRLRLISSSAPVDLCICISIYIGLLVVSMSRMLVTIDDGLEERFRRVVARIHGARKGAISKAVEEAIKLWLEKYENQV
ncbi:MAG TPA: hypothetical protein EYG81_05880 [Archaeoglobus profundus]|nr:hypothetical protein [Archaeoglobus profundus]